MGRAGPARALCPAAFVLLGVPATAGAVIPAVMGPAQALLALLPQLLALLAAGAVAVLRPGTWRAAVRYARLHPLVAPGALAVALAAWYGVGAARSALSGAERVAAASGGPSWPCFQGSPDRRGALPGARGPLGPPRLAWARAGRRDESVESTPALVGNRVYHGSDVLRAVGRSSGCVYCRDAATGAMVWSFDGRDLPGGELCPILSSPAVACERLPDGREVERYLVIGEGFHFDLGRIVCLDLAPVRESGGRLPPRVHWVKQALSHVESSPSLHDGRVYVGAGDDGLWCVELATGRVLWHVESIPSYAVAAGPAVAGLLRLVGKTVLALGAVERVGQDKDDPGVVLLTVERAVEAPEPPPPPLDKGEGFGRAVYGVVAQAAPDPRLGGRDSGLRVVPPQVMLDAESPPVVVDGPRPRVVSGAGEGGDAVWCFDAQSGAKLWSTTTPFPAYGSPTVAGDRLLIGLGNGNFVTSAAEPRGSVLCLAVDDGRVLWHYQAGDTVLGAVPAADGKAYACARDGYVHVLDLADGHVVARLQTGAPMVCSPALTDDSLYATTCNGKVVCVDRATTSLRWAMSLTPGVPIFCSPVVGEGRLFVGSDKRGLHCLVADEGAGPAPTPGAGGVGSAWAGPGGTADRSGAGDGLGLPVVDGRLAAARYALFAGDDAPVAVPLAAAGGRLFVALEALGLEGPSYSVAALDVSSGAERWKAAFPTRPAAAVAGPLVVAVLAGEPGLVRGLAPDTGVQRWERPERDAVALALTGAGGVLVVGATGGLRALRAADGAEAWSAQLPGAPSGAQACSPAAAGDVLVAASGGTLSCLDDLTGSVLWTSSLVHPAAGPPCVSGERIFVAGEPASLSCYGLARGATLWTTDVPQDVVGWPVASEDHVVLAGAGGRLFAYRGEDGSPTSRGGALVGPGLMPPAFVEGLVVYGAAGRAGVWNVAARTWPWSVTGAARLGRLLAPPLVAGRTVFLATELRGLLAVGGP